MTVQKLIALLKKAEIRVVDGPVRVRKADEGRVEVLVWDRAVLVRVRELLQTFDVLDAYTMHVLATRLIVGDPRKES